MTYQYRGLRYYRPTVQGTFVADPDGTRLCWRDTRKRMRWRWIGAPGMPHKWGPFAAKGNPGFVILDHAVRFSGLPADQFLKSSDAAAQFGKEVFTDFTWMPWRVWDEVPRLSRHSKHFAVEWQLMSDEVLQWLAAHQF